MALGRCIDLIAHALKTAECFLADDLAALDDFGLDALALLLCRFKLGGHILTILSRIRKLGQKLLFMRKLILKFRKAAMAVEAALALPLAQAAVGLSERAVLVSA